MLNIGDNIFIDHDGHWLLADFGSCKFSGSAVVSTTQMFYFEKLKGVPALPKYDYFMLVVTILIETLPDKHKFSVFYDEGATHISRTKVQSAVVELCDGEGELSVLVGEIWGLAQ